jgi:hypothetical protein
MKLDAAGASLRSVFMREGESLSGARNAPTYSSILPDEFARGRRVRRAANV